MMTLMLVTVNFFYCRLPPGNSWAFCLCVQCWCVSKDLVAVSGDVDSHRCRCCSHSAALVSLGCSIFGTHTVPADQLTVSFLCIWTYMCTELMYTSRHADKLFVGYCQVYLHQIYDHFSRTFKYNICQETFMELNKNH